MSVSLYDTLCDMETTDPSVVEPDTFEVLSNRIKVADFKQVLYVNTYYGFDAKYILKHNPEIDALVILDNMKNMYDPSTPDSENIYKLINTSLTPWAGKYRWVDKTISEITTADISNNSIDIAIINDDPTLQDILTLIDKVKVGGQLIFTCFYMVDLQETIQQLCSQLGKTYTFIPSNIPQPNNTICIIR
jgi:hypothetical protein